MCAHKAGLFESADDLYLVAVVPAVVNVIVQTHKLIAAFANRVQLLVNMGEIIAHHFESNIFAFTIQYFKPA